MHADFCIFPTADTDRIFPSSDIDRIPMNKFLIALSFLFLAAPVLPAQDLSILSTNPDIRDSRSAVLGGEFFFGDFFGNLWKTDGVNPAELVVQIMTACNTDVLIQGVHNGEVWFSVGSSLYATNGTAAGTRFVYEQTMFACSFFRVEFAGGYVYLVENSLIKATDGVASPVLLTPVSPSVTYKSFVVDDEFYFVNSDHELWISGGTVATTVQLGTVSFSLNSIARMTKFNGSLYAIYSDFTGPGPQYSLAKFDTGLEEFVVVESVPTQSFNNSNVFMEVVGNKLFIALDTVDDFVPIPTGGFAAGITSSVFLSDGTPGGITQLVLPEDVFSNRFTKSGDLIYFLVFEADNILSSNLYVTDGSQAGTQKLSPVSLLGTEKIFPLAGGGVATTAGTLFRGNQVWASDGTPAGTVRNSALENSTFIQLFNVLGNQAIIEHDQPTTYSVAGFPLVFDSVPADFVVAEDAANSTVVGMVPQPVWFYTTAADFSIIDGNVGNAFAIEPATGKITVNNDAAIDFETSTEFVLEITATAAESAAFEHTFRATIEVLDVVEIELPEDILMMVIDDIQDLLDNGVLSNGQANPIQNFLTQALKHIGKGKTAKAIQKIEDAIDRIEDLADDGTLTPAEAQDLINWLQTAINNL